MESEELRVKCMQRNGGLLNRLATWFSCSKAGQIAALPNLKIMEICFSYEAQFQKNLLMLISF